MGPDDTASKRPQPDVPELASVPSSSPSGSGDGFDLNLFLEQDLGLPPEPTGAGFTSVGEIDGVPFASESMVLEPPETEIKVVEGAPPLSSAGETWEEQVSQVALVGDAAESPLSQASPEVGWSTLDAPAAESVSELSLEAGSKSLEASEAPETVIDLADLDLPAESFESVEMPSKLEGAALREAALHIEADAESGTTVFDPHSASPGESLEPLESLEPADEALVGLVPPFEAALPQSAAPMSSSDLETLRKYALLKERELVEKDATIRALQSQIEQLRVRLQRSETERRRLTLALQDAESLQRSLEDARDQAQHNLKKVESLHQEEQRSLQLRLDNAQFQASKAEKKLEDLRERVRADIQKIRLRERELANRLELQKRDAEALLSVKDEKLLQQKREIDRLEYELELLKERMIDETEKAEERMSRLSRALRAMKLAQGLLSEIDEEVLPASEAAGPVSGGEGEAA